MGGGCGIIDYKMLEEKLGYAFRDFGLLETALTHRSYVNESRKDRIHNNERLEFLGDAVLDLVVARNLMDYFPAADEGALSRARASLVSEKSLARIARDVDLGSMLRLGKGEALSGGRGKDSLLADAFEAVIAAVYLDGGFRAAFHSVTALMGESMKTVMQGEFDHDPKSCLQERLQADFSTVPCYRMVEEKGPEHKKSFTVELYVWNYCLGRGQGKTKKEAEQKAAAFLLEELQSGALDLASMAPSE